MTRNDDRHLSGTNRPLEGAHGSSFSALLRAHRAAAGLTQEELADRARMSVRGLRYLEGGVRRPHPATIRRLGLALSLSSADVQALVDAARGRTATPPASPSDRPGARRLPVPAAPLIGREDEVAAVGRLLRRDDVRLLTLTGPGGVGKTRLALEVAEAWRRGSDTELVWVPLAALATPEEVPPAIAQAIGLMENGAAPLAESLAAALRDRPVLLLLDNFEHVAVASSTIAVLLETCAGLKVLATSRAPLRLRAEHEYPVAPLPVPGRTSVALPALAANPAVDLFLRRAQAVRPSLDLNADNATAIAGICRRLEGLPLALELAAARARSLSPSAMLPRLDDRLDFLAGRGADVPERQRTLRATVAWSHELLSAPERTLFRRLAVFAGGFTLPAVDAVCGVGDRSGDALELVEALHHGSLVGLVDGNGEEPRFAMLETVREYAWQELERANEADERRQRHCGFFAGWVEAGADRFFGPAAPGWIRELEDERHNLRAALEWCIATRDAETGLRMSAALWSFWYARGYGEGRRYLAALLDLPVEVPSATRAAALLGAGQLALAQGDYPAAERYLEECVDRRRALRDERGTAEALLSRGFVARVRQHDERARAQLSEALTLARANGHRFIEAAALHHLGMIAADADHAYDAAEGLLRDSLSLYRGLGAGRFVALVLHTEADVALARGDHTAAHRLLREALGAMVQSGERLSIPRALDSAAQLALATGQPERAARLLAAAAALRNRTGIHTWPRAARARDRCLAASREALGEAFAAAWAEGDAMTAEAAITDALDMSEPTGPAERQARGSLAPLSDLAGGRQDVAPSP